MGGYKTDEITIPTKYQWSIINMEANNKGVLTHFNLGLLFKIFSLTALMMEK